MERALPHAEHGCAPCGTIDRPCQITVDKPAKVFQPAKAVNAAKDGAILNVTGTCTGFKIVDRTNLTIQGIPTPPAVGASARQPDLDPEGQSDDIIK